MDLKIAPCICLMFLLFSACGADTPENCIRTAIRSAERKDIRSLSQALSGPELKTLLRVYSRRALLNSFYAKLRGPENSEPLFIRSMYSADGKAVLCIFLFYRGNGRPVGATRRWRLVHTGERWKIATVIR